MSGAAWVTGARGFVGGHLTWRLAKDGWRVQPARVRMTEAGVQRLAGAPPPAGGVVFHLGALAHGRPGRGRGPDEYRFANSDLPVALYDCAAAAGARGFVFVSTAKVLGDSLPEPAGVDAERRPVGVYARSKAAAEERLLDVAQRPGLPLAIVRPPLVYGPGVGANFARLLWALDRGVPVPCADVRRSLVAVGNLAAALSAIGTSLADSSLPSPAVWHVTDGEDLSVAELASQLAEALGRKPRLWRPPSLDVEALTRWGGRALAQMAASLLAPFRLDDSALRQRLGFAPPHSVGTALAETARWYSQRGGRP